MPEHLDIDLMCCCCKAVICHSHVYYGIRLVLKVIRQSSIEGCCKTQSLTHLFLLLGSLSLISSHFTLPCSSLSLSVTLFGVVVYRRRWPLSPESISYNTFDLLVQSRDKSLISWIILLPKPTF